MKHLKSFTESNEEIDYIKVYGLYPEDIKDIFSDLEEEYNITTHFSKKLFNIDTDQPKINKVFGLTLQPFIEVRIKKSIFGFMTKNEISASLFKLTESDIFNETIKVANSRLNDYGWEIKDIKKEHDYLSISIYKINI